MEFTLTRKALKSYFTHIIYWYNCNFNYAHDHENIENAYVYENINNSMKVLWWIELVRAENDWVRAGGVIEDHPDSMHD